MGALIVTKAKSLSESGQYVACSELHARSALGGRSLGIVRPNPDTKPRAMRWPGRVGTIGSHRRAGAGN